MSSLSLSLEGQLTFGDDGLAQIARVDFNAGAVVLVRVGKVNVFTAEIVHAQQAFLEQDGEHGANGVTQSVLNGVALADGGQTRTLVQQLNAVLLTAQFHLHGSAVDDTLVQKGNGAGVST